MENSAAKRTSKKYRIIEEIGEGSYGEVFKAINKSTGETVAIKTITEETFHSWHKILSLNEVASLRKMNQLQCPNIIELKDFFPDENGVLHLIFEFMESNLHQLIINNDDTQITRSNLSESEIKRFCFQLLSGLIDMHEQAGYFHRDLKPENILVTQGTLKIADFGLAHGISDPILSSEPYEVGSLWYRAPEMLICARDYDSKVDMWALGVIMAEMFTGRRLLPGRDEPDQMNLICKFIGSPSRKTWPEGFVNARWCDYWFPEFERVGDLSEQIPNASSEALSLIKSLCSWNPRDRPSAREALQHRFFWNSSPDVARSLGPRRSRFKSRFGLTSQRRRLTSATTCR